jgi:pimeloyl-ACP methyl ester carboxylesterase
MAANSCAALVAVLTNGFPAVTPAEAATVAAPTLAIVGSADGQAEDTRRLATWWPGARLVVVEGAPHGELLGRPEFLAEVRRHLAGEAPAAPTADG